MDPAIFNDLEQTMTAQGPEAAIRRLCDLLREQKEYGGLFYAMLMQKRHQLGVSPLPTGPSQDLPEAAHEPYEEAIRQAGRVVGNLYLQENNLPQAWAYFRMLGEPEPIRVALEKLQPDEGEDVQNLVQIAYYENVHPKKGFDWIVGRFGLCSAITTLGSQGLAAGRRHQAILSGNPRPCPLRRASRIGSRRPSSSMTASRRRRRRPRRPARPAYGPQAGRGPRPPLRRGCVPYRHVAPQLRGADEHQHDTMPRNGPVPRAVRLWPTALGSSQGPGSDPPFEDQYRGVRSLPRHSSGRQDRGSASRSSGPRRRRPSIRRRSAPIRRKCW